MKKKSKKIVGIWNDCSKVIFKDAHEAGKFLGISRNSVYAYISKGKRVKGKVSLKYLEEINEEKEFDEEFIYQKREEDYPDFMLNRKLGEPILCKVLDKGKTYGRKTYILEFNRGLFIDIDLNIYQKVEPILANKIREKEYNNKLNDLTLKKQEALNSLKEIEKEIKETNSFLDHLGSSGGYVK